MELTIEQVLQQGVTAHRKGNLQEAERVYRIILQSQPAHADANHNLGVLAVLVNQAYAALPLFKTAIEANPNIEQFWLSYIDALIREQQVEAANQALVDAKKAGVVTENLNALMWQLMPAEDEKRPPEVKLRSLLEHYQRGRYSDAEKLAVSITEEFPDHPFGWKVLGTVLRRTGRIIEAVNASQKAIALSPKDAESYYNLGNALKELGRLDEAEAIYMRAISLKVDYAEPHNNFGVTIQELGRLDEAEASYRHAIALKPDYFEAHYNLGVTLKDLGRLKEAEVSLKQAIALKSDYSGAHSNLLKCLYLLDRQSLFFDELDYLINRGEVNAVIGSFACRSALKYGVERPNPFCEDPLKYVLQTDLTIEYDFEEIFIERARGILDENRISDRKQSLLKNGYQTSGNLFQIEADCTEEIQSVIRAEIEKYRGNFQASDEGLIKNWPAKYSLYGWLISMKSGGELRPHIHDDGWLSGSVYINVPPKSKVNSGNLVVSLGEEGDVTDTRRNRKEIIDVVTGGLVLFPASLTHHTIPFESEEERIVLAFDVRQK